MADLIIRQARVVDAEQDHVADVAIKDGHIVDVQTVISVSIENEIDASGLVLMPGGIDAHVHFNEPGRADWEGLSTGSAALAKGGFTSFFDMPLNSTPPVTTPQAYEAKRHLADEKSAINAYLWGGLIPGNLDQLEPLLEKGVIGFKAFMSNSGIEDFPAVDDDTLYRGMDILAKYGTIVAVHAENDIITSQTASRAIAEGRLTVQDYLASRPIVAECEAIQRAILFAEDTGCKLHIVHVSSGQGIEIVQAAKARGVDVTCETCPHYLVLTGEDVVRLGAPAKCAPPLRSQSEQDALWQHIEQDHIDFIASDHSPAPASLKQGDNFFAIWGGIAGCQSTLPLLLTEGYHKRGLSLQKIAALTSSHIAERFSLESKGKIATGYDADLVLVDLEQEYVLNTGDLAYKHKISPYTGMQFKGKVMETFVGGKQVYG